MRTYKRLSDKLRRQASKAIQGDIVETSAKAAIVKLDDNKCTSASSKSIVIDSEDDFEIPKVEIRTPGKRKVECNKAKDQSELFKLISDMPESRDLRK